MMGVELSRYRPVSRETELLKATLDHLNIGVVLDVGANRGQYASRLRTAGYGGKIVSFEPLLDAHAQLQLAAKNDPHWHVHERCAIGNINKSVTINVARNSYSSSIRPMLSAHLAAAPDSQYTHEEVTPLRRLDGLLDQYTYKCPGIFLKVDTQGYEWEVIEGLGEHLKNVKAIELELSLVPLYEGQRLWDEFLRFFDQENFSLWSIAPEFSDHRTGRTLQVEAIFVSSGC